MGTVLRSTSAAWARSRRSELGVGHGRLARFVITVPTQAARHPMPGVHLVPRDLDGWIGLQEPATVVVDERRPTYTAQSRPVRTRS